MRSPLYGRGDVVTGRLDSGGGGGTGDLAGEQLELPGHYLACAFAFAVTRFTNGRGGSGTPVDWEETLEKPQLYVYIWSVGGNRSRESSFALVARGNALVAGRAISPNSNPPYPLYPCILVSPLASPSRTSLDRNEVKRIEAKLWFSYSACEPPS